MSDESGQAAVERYEIRVKGHLDRRWSRWFEGLEITPLPNGETLLSGPVVDQAALQGILSRIGDLGLTLVLVRRVEQGEPGGGGQEGG